MPKAKVTPIPVKVAKVAQPVSLRQPLSLAEIVATAVAEAMAKLAVPAKPAKIAKIAKPAKITKLAEVGEDGRTAEQRARWMESTTACALCTRRYRGGKGMMWHVGFIHKAATSAELKRAAKAVAAADARLDAKTLERANTILAARKAK